MEATDAAAERSRDQGWRAPRYVDRQGGCVCEDTDDRRGQEVGDAGKDG